MCSCAVQRRKRRRQKNGTVEQVDETLREAQRRKFRTNPSEGEHIKKSSTNYLTHLSTHGPFLTQHITIDVYLTKSSVDEGEERSHRQRTMNTYRSNRLLAFRLLGFRLLERRKEPAPGSTRRGLFDSPTT